MGCYQIEVKRKDGVNIRASLLCTIEKGAQTWLFDKMGVALYDKNGTPLGYKL